MLFLRHASLRCIYSTRLCKKKKKERKIINLLLYAATPFSCLCGLSVGTSTSNITPSTCGTALYCNLLGLVCVHVVCLRKLLEKKKYLQCDYDDVVSVNVSVSVEELELQSHSSLYSFSALFFLGFFFGIFLPASSTTNNFYSCVTDKPHYYYVV